MKLDQYYLYNMHFANVFLNVYYFKHFSIKQNKYNGNSDREYRSMSEDVCNRFLESIHLQLQFNSLGTYTFFFKLITTNPSWITLASNSIKPSIQHRIIIIEINLRSNDIPKRCPQKISSYNC